MTAPITWNDHTLSINPPKRPKKLTGTRFATVLGLNPWATEFQTWAEICKVYEEPFEDTIYTKAGKVLEPKQIEYVRKQMWLGDTLKTPTDIFGPDYFKKTFGNFYTDAVFGGMWDAIEVDEDGDTQTIFEFKTTKRADDWAEDIPEYYALQAALYAYLSDCDDVVMVATFLEPGDYDNPDALIVSSKNTVVKPFKVSERYPSFEQEFVIPAREWYEAHVAKGVSPVFDEIADKTILKALRTKSVNPDTDVSDLLAEYAQLTEELDAVKKAVAKPQKRLDEVKKLLKEYATKQIGDAPEYAFTGAGYTGALKRSFALKVDEGRLKDDGLFDKYAVQSESTRFTITKNKA